MRVVEMRRVVRSDPIVEPMSANPLHGVVWHHPGGELAGEALTMAALCVRLFEHVFAGLIDPADAGTANFACTGPLLC